MTERGAEGAGAVIGGTGRDPRLGQFGMGGSLDGAPPSARALGLLDELAAPSGPDADRFAGSTHAEDAGILAAAAAAESHAAWLKLAGVRQLIRRHALGSPGSPGCASRLPGPDDWDIDLLHDIAMVLRISWQSAHPVAELAWHLGERLPGIDRLLEHGVLTYFTAKIVADEFSVLDDEKVRDAERRLLDHDLGADDLTPGKLRRLCQRIADTVDPEGARERRERKQRDQARVSFFRDHGGSAAMFATGLPPDEALMSDANLQKRALEYKAAGIAEKIDLLRVLALADSINGIDVATRYALWRSDQRAAGSQETEPGTGDDDPGDARGAGPVPEGTPDPGLPSLINFTFPLATVLGQAARPGEAPGYGSVDPDLVARLAAAAIASPRSKFCLTFTDAHGYAAAHGCARLIRKSGKGSDGGKAGPAGTRDGPAGSWNLTRDPGRAGPEGGYGAWILHLPDGRRYRVDLHAIPVYECGHAYETDGYRPSALLRHLVGVRDGECTAPVCSHPARMSDYEHAVPYHEGGRTDACNGGARSRRCHRVKQRPGWTVTQPRPGWHRWQAPSGRGYTQGPKEYPV